VAKSLVVAQRDGPETRRDALNSEDVLGDTVQHQHVDGIAQVVVGFNHENVWVHAGNGEMPLRSGVSVAPACLALASRLGMLDPKGADATRRWRRLATTVVRWPKPILVAALVVTLIGIIALPGVPGQLQQPVLRSPLSAIQRQVDGKRLVLRGLLGIQLRIGEHRHDVTRRLPPLTASAPTRTNLVEHLVCSARASRAVGAFDIVRDHSNQ
jgi:MMPL family